MGRCRAQSLNGPPQNYFRKIQFLFLLAALLSSCWGFDRLPSPYLQKVTPPVLHGEGPHWDATKQVLYFVDTNGKSVHMHNPQNGLTTSTCIGMDVGVIVPLDNSPNSFVVATGHDLVLLKWDGYSPQSQYTVLESVELDKPGNEFNDGKADARGVFWIGTKGPEKSDGTTVPNQGNLYHWSTEISSLTKALPNLTISNGIAWSPDNKVMYLIDTAIKVVSAFDYDINRSEISNRRVVFEFEKNNVPGEPDGMTIDTDGNLWIACLSGARVIHVDPRSGSLLLVIILPVDKVTSVIFGGPYLDILYVTTSRKDLDSIGIQRKPLSGSVLSLTGLNVRGMPGNNAILGLDNIDGRLKTLDDPNRPILCLKIQILKGMTLFRLCQYVDIY